MSGHSASCDLDIGSRWFISVSSCYDALDDNKHHIPSTVSAAEHSATPAGLVARHVNTPESSGNTSLMTSRDLAPSRTIWKSSLCVI